MRYTPPSADLFQLNRRNFMQQMKPGTLAVFFSNDIVVQNGDANYKFVQNSNTYYLTGIDQAETILVLFPDAPKPEWREILLILESHPEIQLWEGWKYSPSEAYEASGINTVKYVDSFRTLIKTLISQCEGFYLDFNEHERNSYYTPTRAHRFAEEMKAEFPAHSIHRSSPILEKLRSIKSSWEITQLQTAIDITEKAFRRILSFIKPGVTEYQIEAEIIHEFISHRADGHAYDPIIASGGNACVLHYILNNQICKDGELILLDFGANYGNYKADLSRTIPVNGKYSDRQKAIYSAVLEVQQKAMGLLKPGVKLDAYQKEVGQYMESALLELKLLTQDQIRNQNPDWPAYKKYFMHGTSHFLGLVTHDVGNRYLEMQAGMVFTVEPGIYIPEEKIGIRIENNVVITETGIMDLMKNIPITIEEIEGLMNNSK